MAAKVEQCTYCKRFMPMDEGGLIPPHAVVDPETNVPVSCPGGEQAPMEVERTTGWDHHPAEVSGGGWETDRNKH